MEYIKIKFSALFILISGLTVIQAQSTLTATGGDISGNGGSISSSVGQVFYTTNIETSGSIAQGVQHPYEISVISEIEGLKSVMLDISVYPNPARDYIQLKVDDKNFKKLTYKLYNIDGKLLEDKKVECNKTNITIGNLKPSTYILKIYQGKKEIKSFKIIKN